jgi:hypothetical protein
LSFSTAPFARALRDRAESGNYAPMRQRDFFDSGEHAEPTAGAAYQADPDKVRAKLTRLIAEMRAAVTLPWDEPKLDYYRTVVPQMSLWLPEDEAAQIRLDFEAEIARLGAA